MKLVVLLSMLSLTLFTGCRTVGGAIIVDSGHHHSQHMPPSHAPAYGRRQLHLYHYYPNAEFYFDVGRNMYFYLDSHGQWIFSLNLPYRLRSHLHNNYVEIEIDSDRPYLRHKYYKNKYKKHKYKYKKKYKAKQKYKNKKKKHRNKHEKYRDDDEDNGRHKRGRRYD